MSYGAATWKAEQAALKKLNDRFVEKIIRIRHSTLSVNQAQKLEEAAILQYEQEKRDLVAYMRGIYPSESISSILYKLLSESYERHNIQPPEKAPIG